MEAGTCIKEVTDVVGASVTSDNEVSSAAGVVPAVEVASVAMTVET